MKNLPAAAASGASEHRRRHEALAGGLMRAREPLGERDADRAHGDMDGPRLQPRKYAAHAEHHGFDRSIVGEHCNDHVATRGLTRRLGERRTLSDERLGPRGRAIVDCKGVFGHEQIGCHAAAHVPKPDEPDLHDLQLHSILGEP